MRTGILTFWNDEEEVVGEEEGAALLGVLEPLSRALRAPGKCRTASTRQNQYVKRFRWLKSIIGVGSSPSAGIEVAELGSAFAVTTCPSSFTSADRCGDENEP